MLCVQADKIIDLLEKNNKMLKELVEPFTVEVSEEERLEFLRIDPQAHDKIAGLKEAIEALRRSRNNMQNRLGQLETELERLKRLISTDQGHIELYTTKNRKALRRIAEDCSSLRAGIEEEING